jgi:hypothetical protein
MIRIEAVHTFPVPQGEGFAYITGVNNWGSYWPDFVRIKAPADPRWSQAGDAITLVVRLLNRERELNMVLEEYRTGTLVTYLSRQAGLPDARHERHFRPVQGGFEYRLVVTYAPRPGLAGFFDRTLVRRAVARAARKTIRNLAAVFEQIASNVTHERRLTQWNA